MYLEKNLVGMIKLAKFKISGDNTLSLPLYPDLTLKDVNYICEKIQKFFKL